MFKIIRAASEAQWTEHFLTELAGVTKLVSKLENISSSTTLMGVN